MPEDEEAAGATTGGEDGASGAEEEAPTGPTHEPFSFKLLTKVQTQQTANGLRHNDHMRYRQYCTRRLRRLFCALRFKHGRTRFKPAPLPEDFQDMRFLEIPLVSAERSWSYGMQLKADDAASAVPNLQWRHRSKMKFCKAVKHAKTLEAMCKVHGDQRTQLEAEAYAAFLEGVYLVEKEEWAEACTKVIRCRKVCEYLSLASGPEESMFLKSKAQELQPLLRECKYNMGMHYDPDAPDEEERPSTTPPPARSAPDLSGLSYRGQDLAISSDKIKGKLLKCLEMVGEIKVTDEAEEALGAAQETGAVIDRYGALTGEFRDVLEDIHTDMISAGADGQTGDWRRLEAFAREHSISMNVERNLVLLWGHLCKLRRLEEIGTVEARKVCKPEEGMRFCDMLKEDLGSLRELPDTSESIGAAITAYVTIVLNCRCLFLALCYTSMGKVLEAAALLEMLSARIRDVSLEGPLHDPLGRLHGLLERVQETLPTTVSQWRCRGLVQLMRKQQKGAQAADGAEDGADKSPTRRQAMAPAGGADFAEFPPRFRDIPCKPLLFDLAFPSIEGPDIDKVLQRNAGPDGEKKGILGRVAGAAGGLAGAAGGLGSRLGGLFGRK